MFGVTAGDIIVCVSSFIFAFIVWCVSFIGGEGKNAEYIWGQNIFVPVGESIDLHVFSIS